MEKVELHNGKILTIGRITKKLHRCQWLITTQIKLNDVKGKVIISYIPESNKLLESINMENTDYYVPGYQLDNYSRIRTTTFQALREEITLIIAQKAQFVFEEIALIEENTPKPPIHIKREEIAWHRTYGECLTVVFTFGDSTKEKSLLIPKSDKFKTVGLYTIQPDTTSKSDEVQFAGWQEYAFQEIKEKSDFKFAFALLE